MSATSLFGIAWLGLAGALAIHVLDEALTGFLGIHNPAVPLSVVMIGNGLRHVGGSLYMRCLMPGVWSSPALIAASYFALTCALRLF